MSLRPGLVKLRAHRRANRLCLWCGAGLQEEDRSLCVECKEKSVKAVLKYSQSAKGRVARREQSRASRWRNPKHAAELRRQSRERSILSGRCPNCGGTARDDHNMCTACRDKVNARRRKKAKAA